MRRRLILLVLSIIFYTITDAQYDGWMMGIWKSTRGDTIRIKDVSGETFTGTKTTEINGGKITISISGAFRGKGLYLRNGQVLQGSANVPDCSACTEVNKMIIGHDSLILTSSIAGCNNRCDGETFYYRMLSEYDDATQHYLVDRFGRPSDIIGFHPYSPKEGQKVASNDDSAKKVVVSAVATDRNRQKQIDDSIRTAQQKKREKEINDSINLAKQKEQQRIKDSLDNVARIKQQRINDSTLLAQKKKREQEIADSINVAKQKEQQRIKDSLDNVARIRQQQIDDSTRLAQQKKRQQEITDSLNLVRQREQQHIKDSLDNVARIRQQQIDDSTQLAQQKKRQQEITDSLNLVRQKEQQRIKDSLDNVARLEQIRKRTEDSLRDVQAKKRQQEIADSLNLVKQKEQQRIKDSLENVARIRQQHINDSILLAQQKKRQQEIADSLNLARQGEQQRIKDSLNNVARLEQIRRHTEDSLRNAQIKKRQQEVLDSLSLIKQKQRTADSLRDAQAKKRQQEITDSLAAVRKRQYDDSLQKAALAKTVPAPKVLTTRENVTLQTYHISSPDILIELFDNGEIDSDRVSVYHNNAIIVSNQMLGTKAITLNIHADATHREHEFVMVAENLGNIPPNSALMRITAGKQSYRLPVNTDMKTNAKIVFYYDGN